MYVYRKESSNIGIEKINEMYITSKEICNKMTENVLCEYLVIHDTMAIFNKC